MRKCILLTAGYPFKEQGEEFIESEMHFLEKADFDVDVYAVKPRSSDKINQYIPERISAKVLFPNAFSGFDKVKCFLRTFTRPQVWRELLDLVKSRRMHCIRTMIAFCARGERIFRALENVIKHEPDAVLYSYWLVDSAYAIALIKQKHGNKAISRTHAGDLYEVNNGYLPMRKFLLETLDAVYPVSEIGTKYLVEKYGYANKIRTAYLGTEKHYPTQNYRKDEIFHIVSCSYLGPVKRVPLIAEALCGIKDRKIIWTHFGDGTEREKVFEKVKHLPENIQFDFKGNTAHDDIIRYYEDNKVDLFLNVSSSEGIPVSIMEAISYGIPVIATDVGGNCEIVNQKDGFLVSPDITPSELGIVISTFASFDEEKSIEYRNNAFSHWDHNFNAEKNFYAFYSNLQS